MWTSWLAENNNNKVSKLGSILALRVTQVAELRGGSTHICIVITRQ